MRAFEASGRRMTFRGAADDLGVSQGAVAQHVRALEAFLEVQLFERHSKGLSFTDAGRRYHQQVQAGFAILEEATRSIRPHPQQVHISVTPTLATKWLIPNLNAFGTAHPAIDLRVVATERVSSFHTDKIDLAIRLSRPPFGASIDARLLLRQDIIAVAAPGLARSVRPDPQAPFKDLAKIHDTHDLWPAFLRLMGLPPTHSRGLRLNQTALAIDAAIAGQGIALASRFLVRHALNAGTLVQIGQTSLHTGDDYYLLSQRGATQRPAIKATAQWLQALGTSADRTTG
jgi:LysR family glycine cleavage system transcriptional activator